MRIFLKLISASYLQIYYTNDPPAASHTCFPGPGELKAPQCYPCLPSLRFTLLFPYPFP